MSERAVSHRYVDPLDQIWLQTARRIGLTVARRADVFAATDGSGTLWLAPPDALDADDCIAQMILHELCHSLVMGEESFTKPDWGLDNETDEHRCLEHACLRLQAALLEPFGLRRVLAPTTDFRLFYDGLERDPFAGDLDDGSVVRARAALDRSRRPPWAPHLGRALEATATIIHTTARFGEKAARSESLYECLERRTPPHPSGLLADAIPGRTCAQCGWYAPTTKPSTGRCRQADNATVRGSWPSCERFEGPLDCLACGACCREAYDVVVVSLRDPAVSRHRDLMVMYDDRAEMQRRDGRCAALQGGTSLLPRIAAADPERPVAPLHGPCSVPFTCAIYESRPRTCRDFTQGGEHCLKARRRVGLSR